MITAGTARTAFLDPSMDGVALNDQQNQLLVNSTPEVDCLADVLLPLVKVAPKETADALGFLRRILESNKAEGAQWHALATTSDALVRDLRRVELNDPPARAAMTGREIAHALRGPLDVLDRLADTQATVDAVRQVDAVIDRVPEIQLMSRKARYELGQRRTRLLQQMFMSIKREAGAGTSGLANDGRDPRDVALGA